MANQAKRCIKCDTDQSVEQFAFHSSGNRRNVCQTCRRPRLAATQRKYYQRHPEEHKQAVRNWQIEHPEKLEKYYQTRLSSGKGREACNKWRKANPEKWNAIGHRYRARLRSVTYQDTTEYRSVLFFDPCCYCGVFANEIDHIEPLTREGVEIWENLTSACKSCNSSKGNTPLILWLAGAKRA